MTNYQNAASVEELWRRMAERPGRENRELDLTLQVPLIIGCTPDARPYIMILSQKRPWPINGLEAIDVQVGSRTSPIGENWSLTFILRDWSLLHAFAEICLAFADRIRTASSRNSALREIYSTVDQWHRLLKSITHTNRQAILRGVCGELLAAEKVMRLSGRPLETVMQAWTGPYGAPQDYSFDAEHRYWEIKTVHSSARRITISSPEQLNIADKQISLITIVLDTPTNNDDKQLISLPRIIERLRQLADDPYLIGQCIDNGLNALGLDIRSDIAMHTMFEVGPVRVYDVKDRFPRVTPSMLPNGVTNLTYTVEQESIEPFAITNGKAPSALEK
ncbi:Uncharacterised protein [Bifidobacterium longum subsp. infantis]|uniref:PD-(D/E)XK motif protein n=1 Tax=Bifidobacterium longum subsp. infantis TaxID=1682 RepID=A0A564VPC6_BIFLI|nr:PD-(D/E)XK motif protein [Bifidobacterium longum]VUX34341.1 Uncharacterised protein [Bifidobacterium longum subsp. infantis]